MLSNKKWYIMSSEKQVTPQLDVGKTGRSVRVNRALNSRDTDLGNSRVESIWTSHTVLFVKRRGVISFTQTYRYALFFNSSVL